MARKRIRRPYFEPKAAKRPLNYPKIPKKLKFSFEQGLYLLDQMSGEEAEKFSVIQQKLQDYFTDEHYHFVSERAKKFAQISEALNRKAKPYNFKDYYRTITTKYLATPLSALGSKLYPIGGRFNFGRIGDNFEPFGALYLGENLKTSRYEFAQKDPGRKSEIGLDDFFGKAMADFRVRGELNSVLDITDTTNLKPFLKVIQKIEISAELQNKAILAGLERPTIAVSTMKQLKDVLYHTDWRVAAAQFGVPSSVQSFGQMVKAAKIQAIKFPSKYGLGSCLAIFPENLSAGSFVELSDPTSEFVLSRIDESNYLQAVSNPAVPSPKFQN